MEIKSIFNLKNDKGVTNLHDIFCRFFDEKLSRNDAKSACSNMRTFTVSAHAGHGFLAEFDNENLRKDVQTYASSKFP